VLQSSLLKTYLKTSFDPLLLFIYLFIYFWAFISPQGNTKATDNQYVLCAAVKADELRIWSVECKKNDENYMWGNAVKIRSDAQILNLCEVQVYAETYGKKTKHASRTLPA